MNKKSHILLVDDERCIRESIGEYLEQNGFIVNLAADEEEALKALQASIPDLAILDIMLEKGDGIALCQAMHKIACVPVIFLSGKDDDMERIIGLEVGADDYVVKPANPRELLARVRAVLRRAPNTQLPVGQANLAQCRVAFGQWVLNAAQQCLTHEDGSVVQLSVGETRLMLAFVEHPYVVLDRDKLLDLTSGDKSNVYDRSIDNYVSRLRKKIERSAKSPKYIKTYWGGGYTFNCDVDLIC